MTDATDNAPTVPMIMSMLDDEREKLQEVNENVQETEKKLELLRAAQAVAKTGAVDPRFHSGEEEEKEEIPTARERGLEVADAGTMDTVAPLVLIAMLEDANKKLELLRGMVRYNVRLQLVGEPRELHHAQYDRYGLEIMTNYEVDDVLEDVEQDYKLEALTCLIPEIIFDSFQLRFGEFFSTKLLPDCVFHNPMFLLNDENRVKVHFCHRIDVGLGDSDEDVIILEFHLVWWNGDADTEYTFRKEIIADLAGIPLESLPSQAVPVEGHEENWFKLPQLSQIDVSYLYRTLGFEDGAYDPDYNGMAGITNVRVSIPQRVVRHKLHML